MACNSNDGGPVFFGDVKEISAGGNHTVALKNDGTLWAWGANSSGQLGDGRYTNSSISVQIPGQWKAVSAGTEHTVAIDKDDKLWAWGANWGGNLGDGTTIPRSRPVQVTEDGTTPFRDVKVVFAGDYYTVAIDKDDKLWAWGYNGYGQLGYDTTPFDRSTTPMEVVTGVKWEAVSIKGSHTVAIKKDGSIWAWGSNNSGELGYDSGPPDLNGEYYSTIPTHVAAADGHTWKAIFAGGSHTLAIDSAGKLWAWGGNFYGQLGKGSITPYNIKELSDYAPGQVAGGYKWKSVSAGGSHTIAIKDDDTIWTWGNNIAGQLGISSLTHSSKPVKIGGDRWKAVSAGGNHTIAIKDDGSLWAWGGNDYGQLGDDSTREKFTPVKVVQRVE